ncbi:MAG: hypothetical protein EOO39_02895 [Cytophagaceae bacterium]|nr:MAG: hypothetical protein EOO39_02895 [Cytophagaceae bacterium]
MQSTLTLATTSIDPISTNGWDTVSALTYQALNAAIVAEKSSPASFSQAGSSGLIGPYTVSASFGDWQVVEGGDGQNVWMNLPLTNGSAVFSQLSQTYAFSGSATVEVKMTYLPQPVTDNSILQNLKVLTSSSDPTVPVVSMEVIALTPTALDATVVEIIEGALLEWLTANLQDFNQVFAVADLDVVLAADEAGLQWLKPTYVSYAVTDKGTLDTSVFGVLAMTRDLTQCTMPTSHQVSADAIPAGCNGGFLVSQERFLNEMILPGTYLMFNGSGPDDFSVTNDNSEVTNTVPLTFDLTDDDGNVYTANVSAQNFKITLLGKELTVNFYDLNYESGLGVYTHVDYQGVYVMVMSSTHQLQMNLVGAPSLRTTVTLTKGRQWADIGISVAASIAGAVVGAVLGGIVSAGVTAVTETAVDTTTTTLSDGFTEATTSGATKVSATIVIDGFDDTMVNSAEQIGIDATDSVPEVSDALAENGKPAEGKGFFRRNGVKILGSAVGGAIGAGVGSIPLILTQIGSEPDSYQTLDEFAETAISSVQWPNTSGYVMESAELNGSLQIGFNFTQAG